MNETVAWSLLWVALLWSLLEGMGLVGAWVLHKHERRGWWLPMAALSFGTAALTLYFMAHAAAGRA